MTGQYKKFFDGMGRDALERAASNALDNLTAVQERCNALLTENRAMKMAAQSLTQPDEWTAAVEKAKRALKGETET